MPVEVERPVMMTEPVPPKMAKLERSEVVVLLNKSFLKLANQNDLCMKSASENFLWGLFFQSLRHGGNEHFDPGRAFVNHLFKNSRVNLDQF